MKHEKMESRGASRGRQGSDGRSRSGASKQKQSFSDTDSDESMSNHPLHRLFLDELADIYNAEQQLVEALPKMAEAAHSDELRSAFESHLEETRNQVDRLNQVAKGLN